MSRPDARLQMADWMVSAADRELDRALVDLAGSVEYPPTPDIASAVRRRLATQPARPRRFAGLLRNLSLQRRLAVAMLVLIALAAAIVAASPEARTAIAERLGLRGVQI